MSIEVKTESFNAQQSDFRADSLLVWDMHSYCRLYEETKNWDVVRKAIVNDGLGLVTEKISSEKDQHGQYYFRDSERIMFQLTPAKHVYHEVADPKTGKMLMVPTELLEVNKDIMSLISPWRRGIDRKVMGTVRNIFLGNPDLKGPIIWTSTKAEKDEGPEVYACNGQYGWIYKGDVDRDDEGRRRLTVYNFKYPGSSDVALEFIHRGAETISYATETRPDTEADEAMTTVVTGNPEIAWDSESIWQHLAEIQKEVNGDDKIFGLSVDTVLKLQDPNLHHFMKKMVAEKMGEALVRQMQEGLPPEYIQLYVRQAFIEATKTSLKFYMEHDLYGGRRYKGGVSQTELSRYTGSNGDGCGNWGKTGSSKESDYCKKCGNCGLQIETYVQPGERCPGIPEKGIKGCGAIRRC